MEKRQVKAQLRSAEPEIAFSLQHGDQDKTPHTGACTALVLARARVVAKARGDRQGVGASLQGTRQAACACGTIGWTLIQSAFP